MELRESTTGIVHACDKPPCRKVKGALALRTLREALLMNPPWPHERTILFHVSPDWTNMGRTAEAPNGSPSEIGSDGAPMIASGNTTVQ